MQGVRDRHEGREVRRLLLVATAALALTAGAQPVAKVEPVLTQHQKLDRILRDLAEIKAALAVKPPPPGPVVVAPPPPPTAGGIDYSVCRGLTPQECQGSFGPFQGRGLPVGWDWEAAFAAGVLRGPAPPPVVTGPTGAVPSGMPGATIAGVPTSVLPWNGSTGDGQHVEVRTAARIWLTVPAGFTGRRQLDVSHIAPGAPDRVRIAFDGKMLDVPFGGGLVPLPPLEGGRTYPVDVSIEPAGFGCSLQVR